MKKWVLPSRQACMRCHANKTVEGVHGRTVLGFFTAQLNRSHPDSVGKNQLDLFFASGILKSPRPSDWKAAPRWRGIDINYPRNDPNNPGKSDTLEIIPAVIVPGYPEKSVLLFRQWSRNTDSGNFDPNPNQMPPLATFEVNEPATDLIERWIREMPPLPAWPPSTGGKSGWRSSPKGYTQCRWPCRKGSTSSVSVVTACCDPCCERKPGGEPKPA